MSWAEDQTGRMVWLCSHWSRGSQATWWHEVLEVCSPRSCTKQDNFSQVCCGFTCLSIENIQVQNLSEQYSPLCLHSPAWASQACHPGNTHSGSCLPLTDSPLDSFWSNWTSSSPPGFYFTRQLSGLIWCDKFSSFWFRSLKIIPLSIFCCYSAQ